jgi:hypothetical protein
MVSVARSNSDNPATWMALVIRSLRVAFIAFLTLQGKEYVDAGRFDTLYTAIDGGLIGAGTFVVHALLWRPKGATS